MATTSRGQAFIACIAVSAVLLLAVLLLRTLPGAAALGYGLLSRSLRDETSASGKRDVEATKWPNYFRYDKRVGSILFHIILMLLAWVVVMPLAVMLPQRSCCALVIAVIFWIFAVPATLAGMVYSHGTPDLYPHNTHGTVGWIVLIFAALWTIGPLVHACKKLTWSWRTAFRRQSKMEYQRLHRDGSEGGSLDLETAPDSDGGSHPEAMRLSGDTLDSASDCGDEQFQLQKKIFQSSRTALLEYCHTLVQIVLLPLGFLALGSGFAVYGGLAHDRAIFSFLAHAIKGAIFFFYGLLTLGRWMGAFAEFEWAWNLKEAHIGSWVDRVPSAEFTESFVIWLYGASNVFLEHVAHWGGAWTAHDVEHVSITILFFGGGLLGMLVESTWLRRFSEAAITLQRTPNGPGPFQDAEKHARRQIISLNPMPALVILILGLMMSAHHQESMTSTMLHGQWGTLFFAFALARGATYILLYIKQPTSVSPSRPPSELIAAFCLTCGGLVFILSATDVVQVIDASGIDAIAVFTVAAGCTCLVLAWEAVCFAGRGWVLMKEQVSVAGSFV